MWEISTCNKENGHYGHYELWQAVIFMANYFFLTKQKTHLCAAFIVMINTGLIINRNVSSRPLCQWQFQAQFVFL